MRVISKIYNKFFGVLKNQPKINVTWPSLLNEIELKEKLGSKGYNHIIALTKSQDQLFSLGQVAHFFMNAGLPDEAARIFEAYLGYKKDHMQHVYLQTLMYTDPDKFSHDYIAKAHKKWAESLKANVNIINHNKPQRKGRLRIGYTCHFITNSTSSTLLLPLLKAHNTSRVEVFMYSDQNPKTLVQNVRKSVEHWRNTYGKSDSQFASTVINDDLDILLELNGHCEKNRYAALAMRLAPIQINYYNYSNSCGAPNIDYLLVGEETRIDHLQPYYTEKIVHKKGIQLATVLSPHFPPVAPPPFLSKGYITFGSFGQAHKVSRQQISKWCKILRQVPNSRFYMKSNNLNHPAFRDVFIHHFYDEEIDPSRITLEGPSDYQTLLKSYAKVDIALDTFPFGAGTTTIEAIIQGVPVISQLGERFCSQHGYINLHVLGLDELLCESESEYINKAVELGNNPEQLIGYRTSLRERVLKSPRSDINQFINELEDCYEMLCKDLVKNPNRVEAA